MDDNNYTFGLGYFSSLSLASCHALHVPVLIGRKEEDDFALDVLITSSLAKMKRTFAQE
jgi:hypothetical protein